MTLIPVWHHECQDNAEIDSIIYSMHCIASVQQIRLLKKIYTSNRLWLVKNTFFLWCSRFQRHIVNQALESMLWLYPPFLVIRNDDKTAADYKIQGGSVLHLVLALRGGGQWGRELLNIVHTQLVFMSANPVTHTVEIWTPLCFILGTYYIITIFIMNTIIISMNNNCGNQK